MRVEKRITTRELEPGDRVRWRGRWWGVVTHWPIDFEMVDVPFGCRRLVLKHRGVTIRLDLPGEQLVHADLQYRQPPRSAQGSMHRPYSVPRK